MMALDEKDWGITKVIMVHPEVAMNVCISWKSVQQLSKHLAKKNK